MKIAKSLAMICALVGLSACGAPDTAMRNAPFTPPHATTLQGADLSPVVRPSVNIIGTDVLVPRTLRVSEANRYYPGGDIVWREDPIGDRYVQVKGIIEQSIDMAKPQIRGLRDAILHVEVKRFHAVTEKARYTVGGVHNIEFVWTLADAQTGIALTEPKFVRANLDALGGNAAVAAEHRGITQRYRITHHLAGVFAQEIMTQEGWTQQAYGLMDLLNQI
ncbi:DUF6778 family protein [Roseobacteraceae bacterium S113]